jgi:hypothetical protein
MPDDKIPDTVQAGGSTTDNQEVPVPNAAASTQNSGEPAAVVAIDPKQKASTEANETKQTANENQKETLDAIRKGERIALIIAGIVAFATLGQLGITWVNNGSTSDQMDKMILVAQRNERAATRFADSAKAINKGVADAVGKLGDQNQTSRDFATLTKKQFAQDQRPYLWLEHGSGKNMTLGREPPLAGFNAGKLFSNIWIKNYGKSPAIRVHSYAYISIKLPNPEYDVNWKKFSEAGAGAIHPPGDDFFITARTDETVPPDFIAKMGMDSNNTVLAIHIRLVYYDESGNRYESVICMAGQANGIPKSCNVEGKIK